MFENSLIFAMLFIILFNIPINLTLNNKYLRTFILICYFLTTVGLFFSLMPFLRPLAYQINNELFVIDNSSFLSKFPVIDMSKETVDMCIGCSTGISTFLFNIVYFKLLFPEIELYNPLRRHTKTP